LWGFTVVVELKYRTKMYFICIPQMLVPSKRQITIINTLYLMHENRILVTFTKYKYMQQYLKVSNCIAYLHLVSFTTLHWIHFALTFFNFFLFATFSILDVDDCMTILGLVIPLKEKPEKFIMQYGFFHCNKC